MKTPAEFIAFFEAIPEKRWCVGMYDKGRCHCASGHVFATKRMDHWMTLCEMFDHSFNVKPCVINDAGFPCPRRFKKFKTPKQRILAALREIEAASQTGSPESAV